MKTYRVIVTPLALEHLQRIADYIAVSLQAPDTALRWLDKAERAITSLENMPLRFMTVEEEPWHFKGIRRMLEGNAFTTFYMEVLPRGLSRPRCFRSRFRLRFYLLCFIIASS